MNTEEIYSLGGVIERYETYRSEKVFEIKRINIEIAKSLQSKTDSEQCYGSIVCAKSFGKFGLKVCEDNHGVPNLPSGCFYNLLG